MTEGRNAESPFSLGVPDQCTQATLQLLARVEVTACSMVNVLAIESG